MLYNSRVTLSYQAKLQKFLQEIAVVVAFGWFLTDRKEAFGQHDVENTIVKKTKVDYKCGRVVIQIEFIRLL